MTPATHKALLDTIAFSEGTSTSPITKNDGYDVIVTGVDGPEIFTDYSYHPFAHRAAKLIRENPPLRSTASGRYQILYRFWIYYAIKLTLPDFSPASQDAVALQQAKECGGLALLNQGNVAGAFTACSRIWASLPGADYGQPTHTMDVVLARYRGHLHGTGQEVA